MWCNDYVTYFNLFLTSRVDTWMIGSFPSRCNGLTIRGSFAVSRAARTQRVAHHHRPELWGRKNSVLWNFQLFSNILCPTQFELSKASKNLWLSESFPPRHAMNQCGVCAKHSARWAVPVGSNFGASTSTPEVSSRLKHEVLILTIWNHQMICDADLWL